MRDPGPTARREPTGTERPFHVSPSARPPLGVERPFRVSHQLRPALIRSGTSIPREPARFPPLETRLSAVVLPPLSSGTERPFRMEPPAMAALRSGTSIPQGPPVPAARLRSGSSIPQGPPAPASSCGTERPFRAARPGLAGPPTGGARANPGHEPRREPWLVGFRCELQPFFRDRASTSRAARSPVAMAPCTVPSSPSVFVASPAKKRVPSTGAASASMASMAPAGTTA